MPTLETSIEKVSRVIAEQESILTEADKKSAAERDALATRQAADAANLAPVAEAAASLKNTLNALLEKRDTLAEQLRIGRHQLTQQTPLAAEFERLVTANFGHQYAEKNPGVFRELLVNRPTHILSLHIIPRLEAWITEKENEIAEVEAEITALAETAKLQGKTAK